MPGRPPELTVSLPKLWSQHLCSAVVHAVAMAQLALTSTRSHAANSWNERVRLKVECDRLRQEVRLLREAMRIKDSRMHGIPAQRRPRCPSVERLAILELRAARHWSQAQTAERMQITPATISSWMGRLDEEGPAALIQTREPVNKFPEFVSYLVRRLKVFCPTMGHVRMAQVLARAGLHLGSTTARRMLVERERKKPVPAAPITERHLRCRKPNEIMHVDLTTVPTSFGYWVRWLPGSLPLRWPFCWWVAVALDYYSRRVVGFAVFRQQPTAAKVRSFLDHVSRSTEKVAKTLITDQGVQFTDGAFRRWCRRRGIRQRSGAIGKYRSIAVIERFNRTLKSEGTRRLVVPFRFSDLRSEVSLFVEWYNGERPHVALDARTRDEVFLGRRPASTAARLEPRARWPRSAPCAAPLTRVRGQPGVRCELEIQFAYGRKHLPLVALRAA